MGFFVCLVLFCCPLRGSVSPSTKILRPESHFHFGLSQLHSWPTSLSFPSQLAHTGASHFHFRTTKSVTHDSTYPFVSFNPVITTTVCVSVWVLHHQLRLILFIICNHPILLISLSNEQEKGKESPKNTLRNFYPMPVTRVRRLIEALVSSCRIYKNKTRQPKSFCN